MKRFFDKGGQLYRGLELSKKLLDMGEDEMIKILS